MRRPLELALSLAMSEGSVRIETAGIADLQMFRRVSNIAEIYC
jgi:hypothetical protein